MPDKYITLWVVKQVRHTRKGLVILNQSSVLSKKDYSLFPQLYKDKVKIFLDPKDVYLMKDWFSVSNYRVIAVLYFSVVVQCHLVPHWKDLISDCLEPSIQVHGNMFWGCQCQALLKELFYYIKRALFFIQKQNCRSFCNGIHSCIHFCMYRRVMYAILMV